MGEWLMDSDAVMLAFAGFLVWSGWVVLRWNRDRERFGHRLEAAVLVALSRQSPRGVARTFIPFAWWLLVVGLAVAISVVGSALRRWSVLPESTSVAIAIAGVLVVPMVLGALLIGVVRLTGPPASMRLVPRDPTSEADLLSQLAGSRTGDERAPKRWWQVEGDARLPERFVSERTGSPRQVDIAVRAGVTDEDLDELAGALQETRWADLHHANGPATDVPSLLCAVTVGTDSVRHEAWWELWGNIHHQGTVYEVTPWCVLYLAPLAADAGHPDRVNTLALLRAVALGDGFHAPLTREAVEEQLPQLLAGWQDEPELVQRALLLLVSAFPARLGDYPGLTDLLPGELQPAWAELMVSGGRPALLATEEETDRQDALEQWCLAGWYEPVRS